MQWKLQIFDTEDKRGKGVKAAVNIPQGAYILEYGGEKISEEEGYRREGEYGEEKGCYLFLCQGKHQTFW
jgi:SET domain-containing protein